MTMKSTAPDIMARNSKDVEQIVRSQIADVKRRGLVNLDIDPRARFHLDTTKIAYHRERVEAWLRGERVAPITVDMALTQKCSYACTFCYAGLQQNPRRPCPGLSTRDFSTIAWRLAIGPGPA